MDREIRWEYLRPLQYGDKINFTDERGNRTNGIFVSKDTDATYISVMVMGGSFMFTIPKNEEKYIGRGWINGIKLYPAKIKKPKTRKSKRCCNC